MAKNIYRKQQKLDNCTKDRKKERLKEGKKGKRNKHEERQGVGSKEKEENFNNKYKDKKTII